MRDIRGDLQERAKLIDAQINSAYAHFDKVLEQLESERDGKVAELKSELAAVSKLMEAEHRRIGSLPTAVKPVGSSLTDFLVHKLSEFGAMSSTELRDLAAEEGFLSDAENGGRAVLAALASSVRDERIRRLPDGRFAPPTMSQAIALRRVV
jgi:hypothetical protein